jgi:hypothetical protein
MPRPVGPGLITPETLNLAVVLPEYCLGPSIPPSLDLPSVINPSIAISYCSYTLLSQSLDKGIGEFDERIEIEEKDKMPERESYLVIGGCGFLGRHIVEQLLERGETEVAVFDIVQRHFDT